MTEMLAGAKEVAILLGVTRQRVSRITQMHAEPPRPIGELAAGRIWNRRDIIEWASKTGRHVAPSARKV
jgi:hypothetical protein